MNWINPIKCFVYKPACEFPSIVYDFINMNFWTSQRTWRTLERNLKYFGKSFVKSTVRYNATQLDQLNLHEPMDDPKGTLKEVTLANVNKRFIYILSCYICKIWLN